MFKYSLKERRPSKEPKWWKKRAGGWQVRELMIHEETLRGGEEKGGEAIDKITEIIESKMHEAGESCQRKIKNE